MTDGVVDGANASQWLLKVALSATTVVSISISMVLYLSFQRERNACRELQRKMASERIRISELESELLKQMELKDVERRGRISVQRQQRQVVQRSLQQHGFSFQTIGVVESPFPDRRGTPRQPLLVPAAVGRIKFDKRVVQREHFEELSQFSHLWVVFVFHDNTNADKSSSSSSSGSKSAKIRPPRLNGARVGCLSTRSPHRPNDIGLSVCEIVAVGQDFIELRCLDMVDGTPVLDVKPYIPYDVVPSQYRLPVATAGCRPAASLRVPDWVVEPELLLQLPVVFSEAAEVAIEEQIREKHLRHCSNSQEARELITQVLQQDIRGVHQGRGRRTESNSIGNNSSNQVYPAESAGVEAAGEEDYSLSSYLCHLDGLEIEFTTTPTRIHVLSASPFKKQSTIK